jgi:hypothetical protein
MKVDLQHGDVGAVTFPTYPDTEANFRSLDEVARRGREGLGLSGTESGVVAAVVARERELAPNRNERADRNSADRPTLRTRTWAVRSKFVNIDSFLTL